MKTLIERLFDAIEGRNAELHVSVKDLLVLDDQLCALGASEEMADEVDRCFEELSVGCEVESEEGLDIFGHFGVEGVVSPCDHVRQQQ